MAAIDDVIAEIAANKAKLDTLKTGVDKVLALLAAVPANTGIDAAGVAQIQAALTAESTAEDAINAELPK